MRVGAGEHEDEEEGDWAFPSMADIDADLAEAESTEDTRVDCVKEGSDLQRLLKQSALASGCDSDVFFSTDQALKGVAAALQGILVDVETLQLGAAALAASIQHGPMRPETAAATKSTCIPQGLDAMQAFGPCAAPSRAPPAALDEKAPSAASPSGGIAEYKRLLGALPQKLFVDRPLRLCAGDVRVRQDEKDINRDELVVNGQAISGAKGGYSAAVGALQAALCSSGDSWPSTEAAKRGAQLLLSILNRTSSGFAAFEEVLKFFDCQDVVVVSPESAQARPLEASVFEGVALGRAHTRYSVRHYDGSGDPITVIDASFVFRVCVDTLKRLAVQQEGNWPVEEIRGPILLSRADLGETSVCH